jgi:hypothetical protein
VASEGTSIKISGILLMVLGLVFGMTAGSDHVYASLSDHLGKNRSTLGMVAFFSIATGLALFYWGKAQERIAHIRATGIPGRAMIVKFEDSAITSNRDPMVTLHLDVTIEGHEPYPATIRHRVPRLRVGQLTSKEPVAVKVDRIDPTKIVIEW